MPPAAALAQSIPSFTTLMRPEAAEHIRRMRGGSQSRVLINEIFCGLLARRLYLPAPEIALPHVSNELIARSEEMIVELEAGSVPCQSGICFGSRHPGLHTTIFDSWPRRRLENLKNLSDFYGMLVFDIWTSNVDFRQVRFYKKKPNHPFRVVMIDNGDCFSRSQWHFKDKPRLCLYPLLYVYERVAGIEAFEPWLNILELELDRGFLSQISHCIPPEWLGADTEEFTRLLDQLDARRNVVRSLIWSLHRSSPSVFPNWPDSSTPSPVAAVPRLLQLPLRE
jgi:hypothetical protein